MSNEIETPRGSRDAEYTPGPWRVHPAGSDVGPPEDWVTVETVGRDVGVLAWTHRANARLIAAAPELLEALEELAELPNKKRPTWVWEQARSAIAKATGR